MSSANNTASANTTSAAVRSSMSTELDTLDSRLVRAGELSTEIVGTLSISDPEQDGSVPSGPTVTELDSRMERVRHQIRTLDRVIEQLQLVAEEVHKI